jgi:hypothetical protein
MENYEQLPPPCDADLVSRFAFFGRNDGRIRPQVQPYPCLGGEETATR